MINKKELEAQAKTISEANGNCPVFANSKGEFFTNENLALLSEGGKKENVAKFFFLSNEKENTENKSSVQYVITEADIKAYEELTKAGKKVGDVLPFEPAKIARNQLLQLLGVESK